MQSEVLVQRRGPLRLYLFELAAALTWALVGVSYLLYPVETSIHSPVGQDLGVWREVWSVLYVVGCVGVWAGVLRPSPAWRTAGLLVLGTGLLLQFVVAVAAPLDLRVANYAIFAVACVGRAVVIWRAAARAGRWIHAGE